MCGNDFEPISLCLNHRFSKVSLLPPTSSLFIELKLNSPKFYEPEKLCLSFKDCLINLLYLLSEKSQTHLLQVILSSTYRKIRGLVTLSLCFIVDIG
jgi:hypothetical protein